METDLTQPLTLVQLSDLHGHTFGADNAELAELVKAQDPDLILMTGDMLDKSDEDAGVVCELIRQLVDVAPIYYCYGNHEKSWEAMNGSSLAPALEAAGAIVLDCTYVDITVNGQELRLGGYHGYYRYPGMLTKSVEQWDLEMEFAESFEDTERFKLLLCHIPTVWLDWYNIHHFPVDLVLTGHNHGGQIRIPLVGGLYSPYVGLFPEYTEGLYVGETAACVLSTGLGASPGVPRVNNLPQIVVVELVNES